MVFWIEKHRPRSLDELSFHAELTETLRRVAASKNLPHLLFYGKRGCGKRTRAYCLLQEIFGDAVQKVRSEKLQSDAADNVHAFVTSHTVEICASELGNKDAQVCNDLVKRLLAQSGNILSTIPSRTDMDSPTAKYRVVIVRDADCLSFTAQAGLRRTMEKYVKNCRIVFLCESLSAMIPAIRSRVVSLRVPPPPTSEISALCSEILRREKIPAPNVSFLEELSVNSKTPLRALLTLELAAGEEFKTPAGNLQWLPWETKVLEMAQVLATEPSPAGLLKIRESGYELYAAGLDIGEVVSLLHYFMVIRMRGGEKQGVTKLAISRAAVEASPGLRTANNPVVHLEAFAADIAVAVSDAMLDSGL